MKLGVHLVNFDVPGGPARIGPTLAAAAVAAEAAGVANLSAMDHYLQIAGMGIGGADAPMLEGYTTLAYLAVHTTTVDLQLLVTGVTYRHPGLLAKIVSTLDVLSGGRAVLGLGAAWYEREHAAYGVPFPPLAERFERLEETLQVVRQMWSDNTGLYLGKHYRLAETINSPQPLHPVPIMIGGAGERKTLRLVAEYADATNLFARPDTGPGQVQANSACWPSIASGKAPTTTASARPSCGRRPWPPTPTAANGSPTSSPGTPASASRRSTSCPGPVIRSPSSKGSANT
jgi:F420-dependent oxidoreductase-like protein